MSPDTLHELAKMRIAEDTIYANQQRRVREARDARKQAMGADADPSLLDRITTALRKAVNPASRPTIGTA